MTIIKTIIINWEGLNLLRQVSALFTPIGFVAAYLGIPAFVISFVLKKLLKKHT